MAKITQLSQLDLTANYSYADYLTWQLNEAVELIKGKIQLMSPAPNVNISAFLGRLAAYYSITLTVDSVVLFPRRLTLDYMIEPSRYWRIKT
jgi:hypothetical protein